MTLSLEQLKNPPTRAEITSWMIEQLRAFGFVTTGWQPGRVQQTILNMVATVGEPVAQTASTLVKLSYNSEGSGAILNLYSQSRFNNTKQGSRKSIGDFVFQNQGIVPFDIEPGKVVIQETATGAQFITDESIVLGAGETIGIRVTSVLEGFQSNIPNNSNLILVTPLAGVTVTNPSPSPLDPIPPTWANIQEGSDPESDASLKKRNSSKWGLLGVEKTDAAYENLALSQQGIAKVKVISNNPRGPGTVDLLVATATGLPSTSEMQELQALFSEYTFLTDEIFPPPVTSHVAVDFPVPVVLNVVGSVYYDTARSVEEVQAAVEARLDALLASVPVGGIDYAASVTGILTLTDLTDAIKDTPGVNSCTLTDPDGDIAIGATSLLTKPAGGWFDATRLIMVEGSSL